MNKQLTGREREQNAFNAEQAQLNRDFQADMASSQYQRGVADMQAAGVNPALAMSNGGAAAPSGSNASGNAGDSSLTQNGASYMNAIAQMSLLASEIDLKKSEALLNRKNAEKTDTEISALETAIQGSKLDNEQKMIINTYLERQEQLKIANAEMDVATKEANNQKISEEINNMSVERMRIFSDYLKNIEEVEVLKSQKTLTDAQVYQCYAMVNQINQQARYLGIQSDNYDLTQGATVHLDIGFGPFKAGSTQYLTLPQLREYLKAKEQAKENKKNHIENNAGLDYRDYRVD